MIDIFDEVILESTVVKLVNYDMMEVNVGMLFGVDALLLVLNVSVDFENLFGAKFWQQFKFP